jgi:small-conductance mechanosensitive channel
MANYQTASTPVAAEDPGRTLGIIGLILSIVASVAGLIVSVIARNRSRAAGFDNTIAKAGIIVGIITTVLVVVYFVVVLAVFGSALVQPGS